MPIYSEFQTQNVSVCLCERERLIKHLSFFKCLTSKQWLFLEGDVLFSYFFDNSGHRGLLQNLNNPQGFPYLAIAYCLCPTGPVIGQTS